MEGLGSTDEEDGDPDDGREPIVDSWRRSFAAGVDPTGNASRRSWPTRTRRRSLSRPSAARDARHPRAAAIAEEADHLIVVTDADGMLLSHRGRPAPAHARGRRDELRGGHAVERARRGTNAIGTALAADHAVQVFGPEHFIELVQRWTCAAAPCTTPRRARCSARSTSPGTSARPPASLAVAAATARAVEGVLRLGMQERDLRLRGRYGTASPRRRTRARSSRRPAARSPPVPPSWGADRPPRDPARRRPSCCPPATLAFAEPVSRPRRPSSCTPPAPRVTRRARPLARLSLLGRDRALLESTAARRAAPAPRRDPRAAFRASRGA